MVENFKSHLSGCFLCIRCRVLLHWHTPASSVSNRMKKKIGIGIISTFLIIFDYVRFKCILPIYGLNESGEGIPLWEAISFAFSGNSLGFGMLPPPGIPPPLGICGICGISAEHSLHTNKINASTKNLKIFEFILFDLLWRLRTFTVNWSFSKGDDGIYLKNFKAFFDSSVI